MRGLIWKDILLMRKTLKLAAVYMAVMALMLFRSEGVDFAAMLIILIASTIGMGLFNYDESAYAYIRALPVNPRQIVTARYAVLLGIDAAGMIIGMGITAVTGEEVAEVFISALTLVIVMVGLSAPLIYRFGSGKGRVVMLSIVGGVVGVWFFMMNFVREGMVGALSNLEAFLDAHAALVCAGGAGVCIGILLASWLISCRIVSRKEA